MSDLRTISDALQSRLHPSSRPIRANGRPDNILSRITCDDGFSLSVQASSVHYCEPRDDAGPWSRVEVGFPSECVKSLIPFADGEYEPTKNVYGYVPVDLVAQIIADHGGFASAGEAA